MSDLQRDIDIIDGLFAPHPTKIHNPATVAAWQRIRARLTPDRERVKAHLRGRFECVLPHLSELAWADIADTAIKAMEGK